jgi:taurine dioxygenase
MGLRVVSVGIGCASIDLANTQWHTDNSYMERPSLGSILVGVELPEYGNDTMFACTRAAYDALSDGLKAVLSSMKAVHGAGRAFSPNEGGRQVRQRCIPL